LRGKEAADSGKLKEDEIAPRKSFLAHWLSKPLE
jgi:hypothetical protein